MDFSMIQEFIKPELLILVPVLFLLGLGLKASKQFQDHRIPLVLGAFGISLSLLYLSATCVYGSVQDILLCVFTGITQGILVAGGSVYIHQLYKQHTKRNADEQG